MGSFRTAATDSKYDKYRAEGHLDGECKLCQIPSLQDFNYWRIVENTFPYDKVAAVHNMVLSKKHLSQDQISTEAWLELDALKKGPINQEYEFIIEPTLRKRSIPAHFHLHLVIAKDD